MITSAPVVLRPTAPGVAPDAVLPSGPAGASAYGIAVGQGFSGTEEQWLAGLVGPPGPAPDAATLGAMVDQAMATAVAAGTVMPNTVAALQALLLALLHSLPTSPAGLAPGALYLDGGVPAVVQP